MKTEVRDGDALLIVDVQNDFCPGGALAVVDGDAVVEPLSELAARFAARGLPVVASRDWHPPDHVSFTGRGGPWPSHCVRETPGAEFHPDLRLPESALVVSKADTAEEDAYSAFGGTGLADRLRELGVRRVFVGGLATDYCVKSSVLDAIDAGFEVVWVEDASRPVEVQPGDGIAAADEMRDRGAQWAGAGEIEV